VYLALVCPAEPRRQKYADQSECRQPPAFQADDQSQCDLERPTCGRCRLRGLTCSGFPSDVGLVFRNENEVAQRNSERARRERRESPLVTSYDIAPAPEAQQQIPGPSSAIQDLDLSEDFPWLNQRALAEVPRPLARDLETRAVERFFVNWTLYPNNDGVSLGYMQDLPLLYYGAPQKSVLWYAVRALAFADLKDALAGDTPFYIKARRNYGSALGCMRETALNRQELAHDRVLAAILLIDNFEVLIYRHTSQASRVRANSVHYS
jgi:hypothetical protein